MGIFETIDGIWTTTKRIVSPVIKVGFWMSGIGLIFALITKVADGLDTLNGFLASANAWAQSNGFDIYYAKVNAIAPLSETLAMLGTLLGFQVAMAIVRIIKSFVPTVN